MQGQEATARVGLAMAPPAVAAARPLGLVRGLLRFARRKPLGTFGILVVLAMVVLSLGTPKPKFGLPDLPDRPLGFELGRPWLARYHPDDFFYNRQGRLAVFEGPSWRHWLGTDNRGRDIWARLVWGTRRSLFLGIWALTLGTVAGALVGLISAYFSGLFDLLFQRLMDAIQSFPALLILLLVISLTEPSLRILAIALAFVGIPSIQRIVRSVVLSVREEMYVEAARVLGASHFRIMFRHILPNVVAPIIVVFSVGLGAVILAEAAISFVSPSSVPFTASWGLMLAEGRTVMFDHPGMVLASGGAIALAVMGFNLAGDALRDILDPRMRLI